MPLLATLAPGMSAVPIGVSVHDPEDLIEAGRVLASVLAAEPERAVILASSDMTHYESDAEARKKDALAIERIEQPDPEGLWDTVRANAITMCGVGPVTIMLSAARELGATRGELVDYCTSADATGDRSQVVGYAGMLVY